MKHTFYNRKTWALVPGLLLLTITGLSFKKSSVPRGYKIENSSLIVQTDSIVFTPDSAGGWGIYSSYLQNVNDSVQFELILYRNPPSGNDWSLPSLAGTISATYAPGAERTVEFNEPTRTWSINIKANGQCYFKLISGPVPNGNPAVIPMQTRYKK
jgi:hypothetical protein